MFVGNSINDWYVSVRQGSAGSSVILVTKSYQTGPSMTSTLERHVPSSVTAAGTVSTASVCVTQHM